MLPKLKIQQSWRWEAILNSPFLKKKNRSSNLCIQVITLSGFCPIADTENRCPLRSALGTQFCLQPKPYQCLDESVHESSEDFLLKRSLHVFSSSFSESDAKYVTSDMLSKLSYQIAID